MSEKTFNILVVDDDLSNRESLRRRLDRRGYAAASAADGSEALSALAAQPFDLVILDVMMPGLSGIEVLQKIRLTRTRNELPVIMATARDQSTDIVEALENGASDYVTKPLDFAVVLARIQTQLQLKQAFDQIVKLEREVEARNTALERANVQLVENAARAARDLATAADVQKAFLPRPNPNFPGARFAWAFQPCDALAGDCLNILQIDDNHLAFYVLDVSGHGVAASLLAVAAARLLSVAGDGDSILLQRNGETGVMGPAAPAAVAVRLNQHFGWDTTSGQFLTLFYAVFNRVTRNLTYVSAGHPPAILIHASRASKLLDGLGLPIGVGELYDQQSLSLNVGDRLFLYSDGVTEAMNDAHDMFGRDRLIEALLRERDRPLADDVNALVSRVADWQAGSVSRDDLTLLAMEVT